jgi:hypothetical protein
MHLTYPEFLRPKPWIRVDPSPLFSLIVLYVFELTFIGQKKAFPHSLVFTGDTRKRD